MNHMNKPCVSSPTQQDLIDTITHGVSELGITLPDEAPGRMLDYLHELQTWNKRHNLTAIDSLDKMVTHHSLDCLAILPLVRGVRVCDIGSGAGLPGIPLALARPDLQVTLVESRAKKVSFLRHVTSKFKMNNVDTVHTRVEEFQLDAPFDTITARALAPLHELIPLARPLLKPGGRLLAMKSAKAEQEVEQLNENEKAKCVINELPVPGLAAHRCAVIVEY